MRMRLFAAGLAALLLVASSAEAAQGLSGRYYNTLDSTNNAGNEAYVNNGMNTPYATFIANDVCFPNCSFLGAQVGNGAPLSEFLGVAAGHARDLSQDAGSVNSHILVLDGFLHIATAGNYTFRLSSDDGSFVRIDGITVLSSDFIHGPSDVQATTMLAQGAHAIRILQWENLGASNLQVYLNDVPLGGDVLSTSGTPEPSVWAMMILGLGAVGAMMRRRNGTLPVA